MSFRSGLRLRPEEGVDETASSKFGVEGSQTAALPPPSLSFTDSPKFRPNVPR